MSPDPKRAKVTSYILDPIQNIPGYLPLLGGYSPHSILSADYSTFLEAYAALEAWNQRLTDWTLDPKRMSWLNTTGQRQALAKRQDVANYVSVMQAIAADHFVNGSPLVVPTDIFNYLATFSDITIPAINVLWASDDTVYSSQHGVFGWVDCGSISNTLNTPFSSISEPLNGADVGWETPLCYSYHDVTNLVQSQISYWTARSSAVTSDLKQFLASSVWANLTNAAFSSRRIGFFGDVRAKADKTNTFMVVSDTEGNIVDQLNWMSTRGGPVPEAKVMNFGAVAVSASSTQPIQGTVGLEETIPLVITNSGPNSAYGVTVSFQLANGYDFVDASGSQGYVSFNPTNRLVTYVVGPLPPGGQVDVALRVIPLQPGQSLPSANAVLTVGDVLTNVSSPQVNLPQVSSGLPILTLAKAAKGIELGWFSDTDRLKVFQSPRVGPGAAWSVVTNSPVANGTKRILTLPTSSGSMFFHSQPASSL